MRPYMSHIEHLKDIHSLSGSPNGETAAEQIVAGETGDVFLPLSHLRRLYQPEAFLFYLAVSFALKGENLFDTTENYAVSSLRLQIAELLEPDGRFKRRILDFLYFPNELLKRPWLEYRNKPEDIIITEQISALRSMVQSFLSENKPHVIRLRGREGNGRKTSVAAACDMPVLFIDLRMITDKNRFSDAIEEVVLESKLNGTLLCFCAGEDAEALYTSLQLAGPVSRVLFVISESSASFDIPGNCHLAEMDIKAPDADVSRRMWELFAGEYSFTEKPDYSKLSASFRLNPLQMKRCLERAFNTSLTRGNGILEPAFLYEACLKERTSLPVLGRAVTAAAEWGDLILPESVKNKLSEAALRVANRRRIYEDWGFGEKTPYGQGVAVLLEGPPGTGKTMAAHALALRAGLPMYKIDMSALMSKYIGETEKNLQMLFDEAAGTECALFFDEAEAIFSKRTNITDSKDRYSNLEVAFLLQKLEEYNGLTILATNLGKNFDEAFNRRFQYVIRFPFPDKTHRKLIWQSVFPSKSPLADDIDYDYLASQFNLNGSGIKNAALTAAFYAAEKNTSIDMSCIIKAINAEGLKNGISV